MRLDNEQIVDSHSNRYSVRQRMLSGSLGLAITGSGCAGSVLAHTTSPAPNFVPVTTHSVPGNHTANWPNPAGTFSFPTSLSLHPVGATTPFGRSSSAHSASQSTTKNNISNSWHSGKSAVVSLANTTPSSDDLELNNSAAIFSAGSLAGFHQITIDIGGTQKVVNAGTELTASELVAAQQVLSGGKQEITINTKGIGTGGYFDLNSSTVSALDSALGGSIGSLSVSHGVQAIDTLANLNLSGSLVNLGTIDVGAASGSKGQTTDTISAANITNAQGGVITSASQAGGVTAAAISFNTTGTFSNSVKIISAGDLNVTAPTINNSGSLAATTGNINLASGGANGNLTVNGTGGTVQANQGSINFNGANNTGSGNITVTGGNWLSQQVNFNAGTGTIDANVAEVTGVVNGTAGVSHITAATGDLQLGNLDVTGDPTYFNTAGNVTINGALTGDPDVAIVASGNVIANGGSIATTNGAVTIIAGANFTNSPTGGSATAPPAAPNSTNITIADSTNAGKGSITGGYIDLSGITLTGVSGNTPLSSISSGGGNILMVAYKGSGSNSGSIVGTATAKQTTSGASTIINAGGGDVALRGGGAQLTAQNIIGGNVTIAAGTPTLSNTLSITDGTIQGGSGIYSLSGNPSSTAINLTSINASGNVSITTGGASIGTSKAPLQLTASGLTFTGSSNSSSLFVNSIGTVPLTLGNVTSGTLNKTTNFITGGTVSLTAAGDLTVGNGDVVSGSVVNLTTTGSGQINTTGTGLIYALTSILTSATGDIGSVATPVNTAVNTLTIKSGAMTVALSESASAANATSILASTLGSNGTFTLTASQPVTISGALTATTGTLSAVSLTGTGITTKTTNGSTTVSGLTIGADLDVDPSTGTIALTTTGNENITGKSVPLSAQNVTINAAAGVGTSGSPLQTNVSGLLIVNGNSANSVNIKDLGTSTFTVTGISSGNEGIAISSKAATFVVGQLFYSNVTLTDAIANASTTISTAAVHTGKGPNTIGDGTGTVIMTTAGSISQTAGDILGQTVTLTSSGGNIGATGALNNLQINAATLTVNATKGAVFITTTGDTVLNAGTALNEYQITAASGTTLDINGSIKASLTLTGIVDVTASTNATINQAFATAVLSGALVNLTADAGASIGQSTGVESIETKAVNALTIDGMANSSIFVTQTGNINLNTGSGSGAANSSLNLAVSLGDKITVSSTIDFANLTLSAANVTVATGGLLKSSNLLVTSPIVVVTGGIDTSTGTASFTSTSSLTITGAGAITLGTGLNLNGTTGITLGATSGGLNNPLSNIGGTGGSAGPLQNLSIFTLGIFEGAYTQFILSPTAAADSLSITASSLKNSGAFNGGPFVLEANGTANTGTLSNSVNLTLSGSQNTVLGLNTVTSGQPNFNIIVGGANGGSVAVSTGGNLTVNQAVLDNIAPTSGNSISLTGRTLVTTGINSNEFSNGIFSSVSLKATAGTFFVGANTATEEKNGIQGAVTAEFVNITDTTGVFVEQGNITGANITINSLQI